MNQSRSRPRAGIALVALSLALTAAGSALAEDIASRLAGVAEDSNLELTTYGRKTGKPHTVTVWFVVEGSTIYLNTLNAKRDWPRNVVKNPAVKMKVGSLELTGSAVRVTDESQFNHIVEMLREKYFVARMGSWFGQGPDATFRVDNIKIAD